LIVVDASIAAKWMVEEPGRHDALKVLDLEDEIIAPDLIIPEVASVFRKKVIRGEMTSDQAAAGLSAMGGLFSRFVSCTGLALDAWRLSQRLDHSVYDCFYLACALPSARLVSADLRFMDKCRAAGFADIVVAPVDIELSVSNLQPR
jgi:predicted nucleic acid-binding protein